MEQPEWETSKENVCPIRQGRDVDVLNAALKSSKSDLEQGKEKHETAILEAKAGRGPFSDDPLAPCVAFAKWAVENYPSGSPVIAEAVEKACRRFGKHPHYRDDRRLTRLWVRYADMRNDKLDVYDYMHQHRIGETSALFYEAWAATLELARKFDKVEKVYSLGSEKRATPTDRLAQRQREFYKRMAARKRRDDKKKRDKEVKQMVETTRSEARQARPLGRDRSAVADALLSAPTDDQDNTSKWNRNVVRPALGAISERQAYTGVRPFAEEHKLVSVPKEAQAKSKPFSNTEDEQVKIFVDRTKKSKELSAVMDDDDMPKRLIPLIAEVSKENDGIPSKWAGETLPQNSALKRRRAAYSSSARPFVIYQDSGHNDQLEEQGSDAADGQLADTEGDKLCEDEHVLPAKIRTFSDLGDCEKAVEPVEEPLCEKANRRAFSIHRDENEKSQEKTTPSVREEPPRHAFSIHRDESEEPVDSSFPMRAGSKRTAFSVHADENEAPTANVTLGKQKRPILSNHTDENEPAQSMRHDAKSPRNALEIPNDVMSLQDVIMDGPPSPTINTKLAMQEVDDVFNTTLVVERGCGSSLNDVSEDVHGFLKSSNGQNVGVFCDEGGLSENMPPKSKQIVPKFEIFCDTSSDKENALGVRQNQHAVSSPSDSPALEERVFQSIPELEGAPGNDDVVLPHDLEDDMAGKLGNDIEQPDEDDDVKKLTDFFVEWTKTEETFNLLTSEDPTSFDGMFDLELEGGSLVTLAPYYVCDGSSKSFVLSAEDLNSVYNLSEPVRGDDDSDDEDKPGLALKVSDAANIWEFYIYRELERRLGTNNILSLPRALSYFEGRVQSYLALDPVGVASLDMVRDSYENEDFPESVAMLLTVDLLKAVEKVHEAGIVHNDVSLENVVLRSHGSTIVAKETQYSPSGENGWGACGILLVDFNRSIDSQHSRVGGTSAQALCNYTKKCGDDFRQLEYRAHGADQWGFNIDCYGVAVCAAKLLNVSMDAAPSEHCEHADTWKKLFDSMRELGALASPQETVASMRECREEMETLLVADHDKEEGECLWKSFNRFALQQDKLQMRREAPGRSG